MPPIIAFGNQKGGVGKTTSTLALAGAAARAGQDVLVVDLDPQANATTVLLGESERTVEGVYDLSVAGSRATLADALQAASPEWNHPELGSGRVAVCPGGLQMADIERDTDVRQPGRLRRAFRADPDLLDTFDVVLVDCPPSIGRVFISGMLLATHVIFVTEPGLFAAHGLGNITESLGIVAEAFPEQAPELLGVLVNKYSSTNEARYRLAEIRTHFAGAVLPGYFPDVTAIPDAWSAHVPIQRMRRGKGPAVATLADGMWSETTARLARSRKEVTAR
jgi:chromosome partitioning protein